MGMISSRRTVESEQEAGGQGAGKRSREQRATRERGRSIDRGRVTESRSLGCGRVPRGRRGCSRRGCSGRRGRGCLHRSRSLRSPLSSLFLELLEQRSERKLRQICVKAAKTTTTQQANSKHQDQRTGSASIPRIGGCAIGQHSLVCNSASTCARILHAHRTRERTHKND